MKINTEKITKKRNKYSNIIENELNLEEVDLVAKQITTGVRKKKYT